MVYKNFIKSPLDRIIALLGLLMASPILIVVTIILAIDFKGNPFFKQKRPGKNEKIFSVLKFKTMNDKKDAKGNLLPDSDRITSVGTYGKTWHYWMGTSKWTKRDFMGQKIRVRHLLCKAYVFRTGSQNIFHDYSKSI